MYVLGIQKGERAEQSFAVVFELLQNENMDINPIQVHLAVKQAALYKKVPQRNADTIFPAGTLTSGHPRVDYGG